MLAIYIVVAWSLVGFVAALLLGRVIALGGDEPVVGAETPAQSSATPSRLASRNARVA